MKTIEDVARDIAEDILQRGYREAFPGSEVGTIRCDLEGLIERRLTAFMRPEGSVPVRAWCVWWPAGHHTIEEVDSLTFAGHFKPLRVDTITAYLVPPAPEPGRDAVGVSGG